MDRLTLAQRSYAMSRVRSRDTGPEVIVRKAAHALGFRFRLHDRKLPGRPDLVFARLRSVIFVHGCFWHSHAGCRKATVPTTRTGFWTAKLVRNVERDENVRRALEAQGWRALVVWECELKDTQRVERKIKRFLNTADG